MNPQESGVMPNETENGIETAEDKLEQESSQLADDDGIVLNKVNKGLQTVVEALLSSI